MKPLLIALCAAAVTPGCTPPPPQYPDTAGAGSRLAAGRPDWVDGTPAAYPAEQYMTGVGRGPERLSCENDARAALAKIFEAHISQISKDWQAHFSRVNAMGRVQVEAMAISQLTRVSTDYVLKGTRIAEVWQQPGTFHCLAALERLPAARTLGDEIDRLDVQIGAKIQEGDAAPNATSRFFAYKRAMELMQQREALNAELRIVHPSGAGKPAAHSWQDLVAKFTGAQAGVKIGLQLTGKDAKNLQTCLAEQLTSQGVRVLEGTSDVDLMVHGTLKWRWAGQVMGSYMVKINLNLRISDVEGGQTVAAFAESLKTGRPQKEQALQTASTKLCHVIAPKLASRIRSALSQ